MDSVIDTVLFPNEQMNQIPTVLRNAIVAALLKQAPSQMSNVEIYWKFDTGMQKNVIYFLSDFAWIFFW